MLFIKIWLLSIFEGHFVLSIYHKKFVHAATWPGVLKTITECNLQNYSIFLHGDLVFSYFEYVGEDYEADMAKMAEDPVTQDWWTHTHPCFETYAIDPTSEFYHDMKQIFFHP